MRVFVNESVGTGWVSGEGVGGRKRVTSARLSNCIL